MRKSNYLFIFLIVFFVNINYLSADQTIVNNDSAKSLIPMGIEFNIDVLNRENIEDIQVKFKVQGRKSFQYEYLDLDNYSNGESLKYFFSTEQSSRYIPPGSKLTYFFEVFFKDGSSYKTEKKEQTFLDSRFKWEKVEGDIVTIYYHGPVSRRAKKMLEACEESVNKISRLLGVEENEKISVMMYNNYSEMFDVVVKKSETQASSLITEGQAFATENVVLVDGGSRSALGVSTHEITHVIVARASKSSYLGVPLWLNEGLAEYGNIEQDQGYERYLEWAIDTGRLFPFSSLNRFPGNPNLTLVAYGQSKSFVEFLINNFPEGSMIKLMDEISDKKSIDDSFISSFGFSLKDLEAQWKEELGISIFDNKDDLSGSSNINKESKGSCSGGAMRFEVSSLLLLIFAYFVKKVMNISKLRQKIRFL
ncbi:MAG: hypothetical protein CL762_02255 [Chloroflexi bacterium]|nr:hypothetical protein [Chloroflexota bacterium]|tara:strand:+ start:17150 stop:18415 length:1266 start_codon:yes stop_codon:yes gene_type:complete